MAILVTIGYIALCILFFSLAIAIHEWGHFIVALKLGFKVERFSIGFGPAIWKKTVRGVEYRISWIPLGGYVSIPDVDPEGTKALEGERGGRKEGTKPPAWKELLVAVAGPAMNIVFAAVIAVLLSLVPGIKFGELPPVVSGFLPLESGQPTPAEAGGMQSGDRILAVGGRPVATWKEMVVEVQLSGGRSAVFDVERDGAPVKLEITPLKDEVSGMYYIGAVKTSADRVNRWLPARNPLLQLKDDAGSMFRVLRGLVTPKEMKAVGNALGGPVAIAQGMYNSIRGDFWDGLGFLRFLNVNLAVLNLLPIPVLDGGLIMFALIAVIFRRRVPDKVVNLLSTVFMYLIIALFVFLVYRDGARSWRIHTYKPATASEGCDAESERAGTETAGTEQTEAKDGAKD